MSDTRSSPATLTDYDVILVNSSGGKDSQAMLDYVYDLANAEGVQHRIVVVHADLGRVEWKGTKDLARRQAEHYLLPFKVVLRDGPDLLEAIEARGKWPDSGNRYCTSTYKRDQVAKLVTKLADQYRTDENPRPRILNCMGIRAQESTARAKRHPYGEDNRLSNTRRHVDLWYPIFDWTEDEVWTRIRESGVPYHPAYDKGMPRLSCIFCVFAPRNALMIAGKHNPELLDEYAEAETRMGHTFRQKQSINEIRDALRRGEEPAKASESWNM